MSDINWVTTAQASKQLSRSPQTLKRYRDANGGFLELGKHYNYGGFPNSPITWDVEAVRQAMNHRGMQQKQQAQ